MSIFGKRKKETLETYFPVAEYEPKFEIEEPPRVKFIEGTVPVVHKELWREIIEYWDLIHPLVRDMIVSWIEVYEKTAKEIKELRDSLDTEKRKALITMENIQELQDKVRELSQQLHNETLMKRDLEERLQDVTAQIREQYEKEKKALELLVSSKIDVSEKTLEEALEKALSKATSPEQVQRLEKRVKELEEKLKREREENERIQMEIAEAFQEKILYYDNLVRSYKEQLGITDEEFEE